MPCIESRLYNSLPSSYINLYARVKPLTLKSCNKELGNTLLLRLKLRTEKNLIKSIKLPRSTNVNRELKGLNKTPFSPKLQDVLFTIQSVSVLFFGLVKVKATGLQVLKPSLPPARVHLSCLKRVSLQHIKR